MGLFDGLLNLSPEQNQGLLAAAAQLLQAGGPSTRPVSLGQALGAGLQGFQSGLDSAQERSMKKQAFEQSSQLNGLKLMDAESDLKKQEEERKRASALRDFYMNDGAGQATPMPAPQSAASMFGSAMTGEPAPAQPGAMQGGAQNTGIYQQRLGRAERLRKAGFSQEADAQEAAALKFQPKVKAWEKVQQGGKVLYAPYFEDGTSGQPVPLEVAEKLEKINRGGTTDLANAYTGQVVTSLENSVSPDAQLSAGVTMRGQNMTDARQREANEINRGEKKAATDLTKAGQVASFDTMLGTLDRLAKHPGLPRSVGLYSATPTLPGSDSANFQAELETFKSQAFVPMVAQLKGMGALSDAEGKKLTAAVGALDPKMSEKAFKESISRVVTDMQAARDRVLNGAKPSSDGGKVATMADIAETAKKSGKSTAEVTKRLRELGYTIKG